MPSMLLGAVSSSQLMHAGRVSHSSLLPDHAFPVAPSAIAVSGEIHIFDGKAPFETPRPLETQEIPAVIDEYRRAAEFSITAGFDGVELHAATGYLPNQFQVTGRTAVPMPMGVRWRGGLALHWKWLRLYASVRGADRVGIKIAPGFTVNDIFDDDPAETYTYLARRLNPLGLAYLHVGYDGGYRRGTAPPFNPIDLLRPVYTGTMLAVGGFTKVTGGAAIAAGRADFIVYGRLFIANPDLVERFRLDAPLNLWDVQTFYSGGDHGYIDYPPLVGRGITSTIRCALIANLCFGKIWRGSPKNCVQLRSDDDQGTRVRRLRDAVRCPLGAEPL